MHSGISIGPQDMRLSLAALRSHCTSGETLEFSTPSRHFKKFDESPYCSAFGRLQRNYCIVRSLSLTSSKSSAEPPQITICGVKRTSNRSSAVRLFAKSQWEHITVPVASCGIFQYRAAPEADLKRTRWPTFMIASVVRRTCLSFVRSRRIGDEFQAGLPLIGTQASRDLARSRILSGKTGAQAQFFWQIQTPGLANRKQP